MPQILSAFTNPEIKKIDQYVGRKIRNIRIINGLTQKEFAKKLGLSFQQVQKYENGRNRISAGTLSFIARNMDISLDNLINDEIPTKYQETAPLHRNGVGDGRSEKIQIQIVKWINQINNHELSKLILDLVKNIVKHETKNED